MWTIASFKLFIQCRGNTMSLKTGYKQVAMPHQLIEEVQHYIETHKEEGYMSVPEFIREAIRIHLAIKNDQLEKKQ